MKVGADQARRIVHAGRDYFFCSLGCMAKFRSSPLSYLDKTETPAPAVSRGGTIFTCPMHPKIRKAELGSCPICGMALEPVMPLLDDEENPELVNFRHRFWWTLPRSVAVFVLAMFCHMLFRRGFPIKASSSWC
jgi:Cu+-exporting ATPase